MEASMEKLSCYAAACWMEKIWKMNPGEKVMADYLPCFGADPQHLDKVKYVESHMRAALRQFETDFTQMKGDLEGVYKDVGLNISTRYEAQTS
jgi:hypothetical protein